ncbi:TetR/AcrR family transcriptional regulator [Ureibacillus sp. MALMAid1270]|uniref:TetR/AcrR family transcriptional regulator n=1 Tax=Ureibacillus sp. MALMAid1270 TaxID=3411629 RepID=UPI003BA7C0C0
MNTRKRQIIRSARKLFIEKGYSDTSIMDIIASANISKGTFYNHFTSKSECLIAILEEAREEATNRRYEVAMNKDLSDINVLVEQISMLMYVNREHNLVQIFESISGNADPEIKSVIDKHYILEMTWLSKRFVDVFGEEIRKVSFELAVYSLGMMQSVLRTMISATGQYGNPETVIRTILKNIEYLAPHIAKQGSLITSEMSQALLNKIEDKPVTKDMIIEQLKGFIKNLPDDDLKRGHELAQFLLEELESQKESDAIFEVVLSAFNRSFTNTSHEAEAHQISIYIWRYLDLK